MDTPTLTHLSLCSGYGGIDLGLRRAIGEDLRTVAYAEIEAFACELLLARMEGGQIDPAPIWPDLKSFPWHSFRDRVDILSGGYPCQPFSSAGKRLGKDDPRHLWPYIADGIRVLRPRLCFFENVEGHISLGLRDVIEELGRLGYAATWGIFSASEVGAPHQRKRVFILAHRKCEGLERWVSRVQSESNRRRASNQLSASGDLLGNPGYGTARTWAKSVGAKLSSSGISSCAVADSNNSGGRQDQLLPELRSTGVKQSPRGSRLLCAAGEAGEVTIWPSRPSELADPSHGSNPKDGYAEANRLPSEHRQEVCSRFAGRADATAWPSRPGEPQHAWEPPRVVGDGNGLYGSTSAGGRINDAQAGSAGQDMGHTSIKNGRKCDGYREVSARGTDERWSQTQPSLGRDADGSSGGLDYAELCVSGDNRTDELRLLGNGVVPATAERAFLTLLHQLLCPSTSR